MKTSNEEKITIIKLDGEYHWKPWKTKQPTAKIPAWLLYGYIEHRSKLNDIKQEIETYFK